MTYPPNRSETRGRISQRYMEVVLNSLLSERFLYTTLFSKVDLPLLYEHFPLTLTTQPTALHSRCLGKVGLRAVGQKLPLEACQTYKNVIICTVEDYR